MTERGFIPSRETRCYMCKHCKSGLEDDASFCDWLECKTDLNACAMVCYGFEATDEALIERGIPLGDTEE